MAPALIGLFILTVTQLALGRYSQPMADVDESSALLESMTDTKSRSGSKVLPARALNWGPSNSLDESPPSKTSVFLPVSVWDTEN